MPTLVRDDPKTRCRKTNHEAVKCPKAEFCCSIKSRMGKVKVLGGDIRVDVVECVDEASDDHYVLEDVHA